MMFKNAMTISIVPLIQDRLKRVLRASLFPKKQPSIKSVELVISENKNIASPFAFASAAPNPTQIPSMDSAIAMDAASNGEMVLELSASATSGSA